MSAMIIATSQSHPNINWAVVSSVNSKSERPYAIFQREGSDRYRIERRARHPDATHDVVIALCESAREVDLFFRGIYAELYQ